MNTTARIAALFLLAAVLITAGLRPALARPLHDAPVAAPDAGEKIKVVGSIALAHAPGALGVNPVSNRIYIANSANWLTVIDGAAGWDKTNYLTSFFTGSRFAQQLGIDARRNLIYMANKDGNGLIVIDGETNTQSYSATIGATPEGIAVDSDTRTLYIAHSGSVLSWYDAQTFQQQGFLYTDQGSYSHTLAVNPRLHRIYISMTSNVGGKDRTDVIDTTTNTKIGFIPGSGNADANFVTGKLYIADYHNSYVTVVDGRTNQAVAWVGKDSPGGFVTVNPTTNCIYVTNPDKNTVTVIDGRTDKLVATVGVGARPQQIAVNPANGLVYVSNSGAESVHIIQDNLCGRGQRVWRLLYYLPGDNQLGNAQKKLATKLEGLQGKTNFHASIMFDGPADGDSRYVAISDSVDELAKGELNTGDPRSLMEWIGWSREVLPATYTALIIAGHGNLGGATLDQGAGADALELREMRDVLQAIMARYGRIDVLYMNSSLMATLEGAYELRPYVDYYVSSQNTATVDVDALPSSYLNHLAADLTPRDLALDMGRSNAEGLRGLGMPFTVSVADLKKLPNLVTDVNNLAVRLKDQMPAVASAITDQVLPTIQRFDMNGVHGTDIGDELVDLYDFADQVSRSVSLADVRDAAERVKVRIRDEYIIFEAHSSATFLARTHLLDKSHGVSVFFPDRRSSFYDGANFTFAAGVDWNTPGGGAPGAAVEWAPMLVSYVLATNPEAPDDGEPPPLVVPSQALNRVFLPTLMREPFCIRR